MMASTWIKQLSLGLTLACLAQPAAAADTLDTIRQRGQLIWGADEEGGGPYVYSDSADPGRKIGFEVELAELLARQLGVQPKFFQGPWDNLPPILNAGQIDIILNGYELTAARAAQMDRTAPYYIYQYALLARHDDDRWQTWEDLGKKPDGHRPKIGVLGGSAAERFLESQYGDAVEIISFDSNTDAMDKVVAASDIDITVADLPVAVFYRDRYLALRQVGSPQGRGYYVIYVRRGDTRLQSALNGALAQLIASGQLRSVYERYGLWSDLQDELPALAAKTDEDLAVRSQQVRGWQAIVDNGWLLLEGAGMTIILACLSMPLAIVVGLFVALGRLYGPAPLRWLLVAYVEVLRGTPLMLQLYVIYFMLPQIGFSIRAFYAAIAGLAINYSAYEAEIYRAGLQAIPRGQMEAALALGMSPALALRRIIVPQAVRIVIPPVTNDFIALFKDTSVCSVITVVELTKQYNIARNNTGATIELALVTALLYLLMSVPLARLANHLEHRMRKA